MTRTETSTEAVNGRYYSFDALRGSMMALGIVIHSATAYSTLPEVWWIKDAQTSKWMDAILLYLHTFRLPVFFVMAGFFAALLVTRRGWQKMLENRMMRIALPMILALLFIFPPLRLASVYHYFSTHGQEPWGALFDWLARGRFQETLEPGHMWFLETLIWVTLVTVACRRWLHRLEGAWFMKLASSRWGIPLLAVVSALTLGLSRYGLLDTPKGFSPHWHVVLSYLVFYIFGWGLYLNRTHLSVLRRYGWKEMSVSLPIMVPLLISIEAQLAAGDARAWGALAATAATSALMGWTMVYGLMGFFMRRLRDENPRVKYFSDASYWVYLTHPIALLLIQFPLLGLALGVWVKFVIGLAFASGLTMLTYDVGVRRTWVGVLLNGKRMERWQDLPAPASAPVEPSETPSNQATQEA